MAIANLSRPAFEANRIAVKSLIADPEIYSLTQKYIEENKREVARQKLAELINFTPKENFEDISPAAFRIRILWEKFVEKTETIVKKYSLKKFNSFKEIDRHIDLMFEKDSYNALTLAVGDCMKVLKVLAEQTKCEPVTKAILCHLFLAYIHPWNDGNGRVSRFLMNHYLCHSKLSWVVINAEEREKYFKSLEKGQTEENIEPFATFIAEKISASSQQ